MPRRFLALALAAGLVVGLAACGGGDDDESADVTVAPATTAPDTTAAPTTTEPVTDDTGDAGGAVSVDNFGTESGITDEGDTYDEFVEVTDDSGQIFVEVPAAWSDTDTSATGDGNPSIQASPDLGGDIESTPVLGYTAVAFTTPPDLDDVIEQTAAATTGGECDADTPNDYADGVFSGRIQAFVNCGGSDRAWLFVAATPDNGDSYGPSSSARPSPSPTSTPSRTPSTPSTPRSERWIGELVAAT